MGNFNIWLTLITFIPWIIIYLINMLRHLNNPDYREFKWSYFKKNILEIFRIDILVLIFFFFFFASYKMDFVNKYIFPVMCLYLCVNSFYEKKNKYEKHFLRKYIGEIILIFLILTIPFIIYKITVDLDLTYKIMLLYLFFEYFIMMFICYIIKLIKKIRGN